MIILCGILILPSLTQGEMIYLKEVRTEEKPTEVKYYSEQELMEMQSIKNVLIRFVKSQIKSKAEFLSSKYKNIFKNLEKKLAATFNKESYFKMDIRKIEYFKEAKATAEANLYWAFEGYQGVQTFHFSLVKENGQWLIDWMVY
jgi:hypothetical protein